MTMAALDAGIAAMAAGRTIIIAGDRLRRGDIDFAVPARAVTADAINFMATHGRGLICLAITPPHALRLGIGLINAGTERQTGRPFGRSIEARTGVTTGISAADRAHTVRVACADGASGDDIVSPGHVFPLIAHPGGVAARHAAVEAAIALSGLAGMGEAAVICSIMRDDGEMARVDDMADFAAVHAMPIVDIADLVARMPA